MDPACDCPSKIIVRRTISSGAIQYGTQCQRCGKWSAVKKASLDSRALALAGEYDKSIGERRFLVADCGTVPRTHRGRAAAYPPTSESGGKPNRQPTKLGSAPLFAERDNHICQACLRRKATQVHHLTYEHCQNAQGEFGYEPLFDLASICDLCHEAFHKISREKRTYATSN